jgi:hypothetical protein
MQTTRNKTRRASGVTEEINEHQVQPVDATQVDSYGMNTSLVNFLNLNASQAYKRRWHLLERGLRLNRLSLFIAAEKEKLNLSDEDTEYLTNVLHRSLDKKLLNSKTTVVYDIDTEQIQEIRGLVYHKTADGKILSQIVEKKAGLTFRKPHSKRTATKETPATE